MRLMAVDGLTVKFYLQALADQVGSDSEPFTATSLLMALGGPFPGRSCCSMLPIMVK